MFARKKYYFQYKGDDGNYYLTNPYDKLWKHFLRPFNWVFPIRINNVYKYNEPQYKRKTVSMDESPFAILGFGFIMCILFLQIAVEAGVYFWTRDLPPRFSDEIWHIIEEPLLIRLLYLYIGVVIIQFIIWNIYIRISPATIKINVKDFKMENPSKTKAQFNSIKDKTIFAKIIFLLFVIYALISVVNITEISDASRFLLVIHLIMFVMMINATIRFSLICRSGKLSNGITIEYNHDWIDKNGEKHIWIKQLPKIEGQDETREENINEE